MSTRTERDANKAQNERNTKVLKEMMLRSDNRTCADCRKKDPRWVSWNLGVFVCIRCSGVHRSMGTHISKVKSADLDMWTQEQVDHVLSWGNSKANIYWEAELPPNYIPPEGNIEQWIRAKYERKQFASKGPLPDPDSIPLPEGVVQTKAQQYARQPLPQAKGALMTGLPGASLANRNFFHGAVPVSSAPSPPATIAPPLSHSAQLFAAFSSPSPAAAYAPQQSLKDNILSLYTSAGTSGNGSSGNIGPANPMASPTMANFGNFSGANFQGSGSGTLSSANPPAALPNFGSFPASSSASASAHVTAPAPTQPTMPPASAHSYPVSNFLSFSVDNMAAPVNSFGSLNPPTSTPAASGWSNPYATNAPVAQPDFGNPIAPIVSNSNVFTSASVPANQINNYSSAPFANLMDDNPPQGLPSQTSAPVMKAPAGNTGSVTVAGIASFVPPDDWSAFQ